MSEYVPAPSIAEQVSDNIRRQPTPGVKRAISRYVRDIAHILPADVKAVISKKAQEADEHRHLAFRADQEATNVFSTWLTNR